jgi:hypothetical protein
MVFDQKNLNSVIMKMAIECAGNTKRGKYPCTFDLLFDWFGFVCFANRNKNYQKSYSRFQTSQTGGQWYSDTSPFSIPWNVVISCLFI